MKVLLINNFHYRKGGSEAVYFNTADILLKHGHEVIFFSTTDQRNIDCGQKEYFVRQNKDVSAIRGALNYFYNTEAKRNLAKLIEREKPDIAHVHLFWGGISPSIFGVLKRYGIPLVHTVHDYRMVCPAYAFKLPNGTICEKCQGRKFHLCAKNRCAKGSLVQSCIMSIEMYVRNMFFNPVKNIDGFIFVSEFSRKKHRQYMRGITDDNSIVLYNTTPDNPMPLSDTENDYFLYFGRLSYEKGLDTLIKTFIDLPDINLKIAGTGPEEMHLKESASQAGNIKFLGYKTGAELQSIIANAKFVIIPSEWYENNPMTIIEAYSLGTPIIGRAIGGIPEIVEEGKTGFVFEPQNIDSLRKVLTDTINMPINQYTAIQNNTREYAKAHFDTVRYYKKLIAFYNEYLYEKEEVL